MEMDGINKVRNYKTNVIFLITRFFHLCEKRKMNSCWENYLKDGQITKLLPSSSQEFFVIFINTISAKGGFLLLKKLASYPSITWLVMRSLWNIAPLIFFPNFILLSSFTPFLTLGLLHFIYLRYMMRCIDK